jgi:hypothetical protein
MASLAYRRGGWELRYRDLAGKQRVERFRAPETKRPPEEALDRQAEVERELRRGSYIAREAREVTFGVYYERWLASRRTSATRAYTDESRARLHVLPQGQDRPLSSIRPSDVDNWIAELSRKMGPDLGPALLHPFPRAAAPRGQGPAHRRPLHRRAPAEEAGPPKDLR